MAIPSFEVVFGQKATNIYSQNTRTGFTDKNTVSSYGKTALGYVDTFAQTFVSMQPIKSNNLRIDSFGVQQFYEQKVEKQSIVLTNDPNTQPGFRLDGGSAAIPQVQGAFHYYTISSRVGDLASGGTQYTMRIDLNPLLSMGKTVPWTVAEQQGYQVVPQDIDEFEQTGYFRVRDVLGDNHFTYKQGGEHITSAPDLAGSFGMDINFGGYYNSSSNSGATSEKELVFPEYEFFHDSISFDTGSIVNKWIGIKEISRHTPDGQLYEVYLDLDPIDFATGKPKNNWQAFSSHLDDGGEDGIYAGHITSWGKKFFQYRINQAQNIDFALLSVHQIDPSTAQNIPSSVVNSTRITKPACLDNPGLCSPNSNENNSTHLISPVGITIDKSNNIYVADSGNDLILKFDSSGDQLMQFGSSGKGDSQFIEPRAIALDSSGNIYVVDLGNDRIEKFDSSGKFLLKFGSHGVEKGQFRGPSSLAIDDGGNLYVTDGGNSRIEKFDSSGSFLLEFGSYGSGDGQFESLGDVRVDDLGNVYVSSLFRVQKFDSSGHFISKFSLMSSTDVNQTDTVVFTTDNLGDIFTTNNNMTRIQKLDSQGNLEFEFGSSGSSTGQFNHPQSIAVDNSGNIYVADSGNNRIEKFDPTGKFLSLINSLASIPEFPFTGLILLSSFISFFVFYRIKFRPNK